MAKVNEKNRKIDEINKKYMEIRKRGESEENREGKEEL